MGSFPPAAQACEVLCGSFRHKPKTKKDVPCRLCTPTFQSENSVRIYVERYMEFVFPNPEFLPENPESVKRDVDTEPLVQTVRPVFDFFH